MTNVPPDYLIRPVEDDDLPAWWELRQRGIREHPDMFGSAIEDIALRPLDEIGRSFRDNWSAGDNRLFAAFDAANLPVATLGFIRLHGRKQTHRAEIWGVYTAPEARRRGLATRLLGTAVAHGRSCAGLRQIHLTVSSHNATSIRAYERAGFVRYGREPRAILLPDGPVDEDLMVLFLDDFRLPPSPCMLAPGETP